MKASKLIKLIKKEIEKKGDIPVVVRTLNTFSGWKDEYAEKVYSEKAINVWDRKEKVIVIQGGDDF